MEKHLYYNMAQISNSFNFSWSRWNLPADRRKIVVQMREYFPDKGKQVSIEKKLDVTSTCVAKNRSFNKKAITLIAKVIKRQK